MIDKHKLSLLKEYIEQLNDLKDEKLTEDINELLKDIDSENSHTNYGLIYEELLEEDIELLKTHNINKTPLNALKIEKDPNKPVNYILEGDNYYALKSLLDTHKGLIDTIYIDPPYNTGNKYFVYTDTFTNHENDFKHSTWLSFMDKRLVLAKELLADDGVIFLSIDDNEYAQLKLLCDKIFGEHNFITTFSWLASRSSVDDVLDNKEIVASGANAGMFKGSHEYILCYRKTNDFKFNLIDKGGDSIDSRITKKGNSISQITIPKGTLCESNITKTFKGVIGGTTEPIAISNPEGMVIVDGILQYDTILESCFANKNMVDKFFSGETVIDRKGQRLLDVYLKQTGKPYMKKEKLGEIPTNILSGYGDTSKWAKHLKDMFHEPTFNYPKPYPLVMDLLKLHRNKNAVVLDFFAGSGTTGQAVMELNKKDGGNRQFILATNNEVSETKELELLISKGFISEKPKVSKGQIYTEWLNDLKNFKETAIYREFLDSEDYLNLGICRSVTYERLKKVINGYETLNKKHIEGIPNNLEYIKLGLITK